MTGASTHRKEASSTSRPDPVAYNRLVAHATVQGIRLIGTRFDVSPKALSSDRSKWSYRLHDELVASHCDEEALQLRGEYIYEATCISSRSRMVKVTGRYLATFGLSSACAADAGDSYLRNVGRFACYPYFRALFATLTDQCGLLLPPLPIISGQPRLVREEAGE